MSEQKYKYGHKNAKHLLEIHNSDVRAGVVGATTEFRTWLDSEKL